MKYYVAVFVLLALMGCGKDPVAPPSSPPVQKPVPKKGKLLRLASRLMPLTGEFSVSGEIESATSERDLFFFDGFLSDKKELTTVDGTDRVASIVCENKYCREFTVTFKSKVSGHEHALQFRNPSIGTTILSEFDASKALPSRLDNAWKRIYKAPKGFEARRSGVLFAEADGKQFFSLLAQAESRVWINFSGEVGDKDVQFSTWDEGSYTLGLTDALSTIKSDGFYLQFNGRAIRYQILK